MVGPNTLHTLNARNHVRKIGYVNFWFRLFNMWPCAFFYQKMAKIGQKVIVFFLKNQDKIGPWYCNIRIAQWCSFVFESSFFQFWPPSWRKMRSKLDKNWKKGQTLIKPYFCKHSNFWKKFSNSVLHSFNTNSGANFSKIAPYLGELGPKKTPKMGHFMVAPSPQKHLKFYNFTTTNGIKMKLTTIVHLHETFHLA